MLRTLKQTLTGLAFVVFCFSAVQADTVTINGDTLFAPPVGTRDGFFNRPAGETDIPPTGLSIFATDVAYDSIQFTVSLGGTYTLLLESLEPAFYDPFLALYANSFNPASGLTNLIGRNDDLTPGDFTRSGLTLSLNSGVNYFAVVTGFSNFDSGLFRLTVSGPGIITVSGGSTVIPEPATMILLGTGLAGVAAKVRIRRKAQK